MLDLAIALLLGINVGYVLRLAHEAWDERVENETH